MVYIYLYYTSLFLYHRFSSYRHNVTMIRKMAMPIVLPFLIFTLFSFFFCNSLPKFISDRGHSSGCNKFQTITMLSSLPVEFIVSIHIADPSSQLRICYGGPSVLWLLDTGTRQLLRPRVRRSQNVTFLYHDDATEIHR